MKAAIDIGSNTVRMLVGDSSFNRVLPRHYFRQVTRLGGGYNPIKGIDVEAMGRTIQALELFAQQLSEFNPERIRAVATEAVRRSVNREQFVAEVLKKTGIVVEIIAGEEEAALSSAGVMAALNPSPLAALIFDIGGGSTEFIVIKEGKRLWQKSYRLGVISLVESEDSRDLIAKVLIELEDDLRSADLDTLLTDDNCILVGTAGTVTTLAAIDLAMSEYDWRRINNYLLPLSNLQSIHARLLPLTAQERERISGVEKGRGDLILPGAEIVISLLSHFRKEELRVCDFGLLEGILLSMA